MARMSPAVHSVNTVIGCFCGGNGVFWETSGLEREMQRLINNRKMLGIWRFATGFDPTMIFMSKVFRCAKKAITTAFL